jgi:hypothetical protein
MHVVSVSLVLMLFALQIKAISRDKFPSSNLERHVCGNTGVDSEPACNICNVGEISLNKLI